MCSSFKNKDTGYSHPRVELGRQNQGKGEFQSDHLEDNREATTEKNDKIITKMSTGET